MRLINTKTLELEDVFGQPPRYAILSHTWELGGEVSYQDFLRPEVRETKSGFNKIKLTCDQARKDGLDYAWVDTCCIDKTSSADLSEAINSMFKWYQKAAVCYAYLVDVPGIGDKQDSDAKFASSRWFTRGWTLQELIAPETVRFFSFDWVELGNKVSLSDTLHNITRIRKWILLGLEYIQQVSVAERMSWAAHRQTTREEDTAYCLMGLFNVNMPMLYGEGSKAFLRLQEEILKETDDHSLFAWRASVEAEPLGEFSLRGLLANSPSEFSACTGIVAYQSSVNQVPLSVTSKGVHLDCLFQDEKIAVMGQEQTSLAGLNCRRGDNFHSVIAIQMIRRENRWFRSHPHQLYELPPYGHYRTVYVAKCTNNLPRIRLDTPDLEGGIYISKLPSGMHFQRVHSALRFINFPKLRTLTFGSRNPFRGMSYTGSDFCDITLQFGWDSLPYVLEIFLWQSMQLPPRKSQFAFRASVRPFARGQTGSADQPSSQIETKPEPPYETQVLQFGPEKNRLTVSLKPGFVQGYDMFILEVFLHRY
ncbi:heterokaryon incompatibility protein-domain-containing protein [Echria macrotheca]|uniref:Heterokaryon incompatibility protein-domain-containing protein n=1 Tax=Echria macrotheca TaxID=438768 RepID=A0AAJ0FE97_9PEZI|nr:heterokaryon incompatibility protein-domain-containing protein [Echria macrotheca]